VALDLFFSLGFDRLNRLLPPEWSPAKRHQYLRTRLVGSDIDDFAIEVAALSLVVTDPENRNGWQVHHRNVLEATRADFRTRPTVILTNPPFKEIKEHGTRRELAGDILVRLIQLLASGGLLGVVLPQSICGFRVKVNAIPGGT
jgi:16S rRNA G1207 methylase RsmC